VAFLVSNLKGAELRVFLLRRPAETAPGESDDADDNKDDADDRGRFHCASLQRPATLDQLENQHHNRNDEQDVNESAQRVGTD